MEVKSLCIDLMPAKEIHGQRDTQTHTRTKTQTHGQTDTHIRTDRHRQTHGHTDRMTIKLEIRKRTVHIKLQSQEKNSQEKN